MLKYTYILGCILFTVYGQLIIKWRMNIKGAIPDSIIEKISFLFALFMDPFILSGFLAAFIASLFWMVAMTKFEISTAYPFMSLAFVLVLIFSNLFLGEIFTLGKILGLFLIIAGLILTVRL
jgi:drug/metabolite transporter (DMT)-like permease